MTNLELGLHGVPGEGLDKLFSCLLPHERFVGIAYYSFKALIENLEGFTDLGSCTIDFLMLLGAEIVYNYRVSYG
jgi:hypothetical protein